MFDEQPEHHENSDSDFEFEDYSSKKKKGKSKGSKSKGVSCCFFSSPLIRFKSLSRPAIWFCLVL